MESNLQCAKKLVSETGHRLMIGYAWVHRAQEIKALLFAPPVSMELFIGVQIPGKLSHATGGCVIPGRSGRPG
jgi:hypothetical protein